ncbi:MAG: EVE domain-containing protein [Deltaproteobacteria bacterium]|nr:EVE domain-containing protein [Deltaproteobacteria bacterium]
MTKWLVKTEESVYSIDRFQSDKKTVWEGVRNYQARNYLRAMQKGDEVLVYHSNSDPTAIVGLAQVRLTAFADPSQFDPKSEFFDPKASKEAPRWFCPEFGFVKKFKRPLSLEHLKGQSDLKGMVLLQRGSRLSVQPVTDKEFTLILKLAE